MILDMIARLPGLTEVDGSISPLEELDDSTWTRKDGTGPVYVLISVDVLLQWPGVYIYTLG